MNLPNKITIVRMCLIPVMVVFFYLTMIPYNYLIATGIFIVAACTDFIDGYIARKYNLVTNLGKFLDPIADKVLVVTALILLVECQTLPLIWGAVSLIVVIAREFAISAFRLIAASNNVVIAADGLGKLKTIFQTVAIPMLLFATQFIGMDFSSNAMGNFMTIVLYSGYVVFAISMLFTIISGISYIVKNKNVLKNVG